MHLRGLSHEIFRPVWMHLGLNVNRLWFKNFLKLLRFLATILSFGALHTKPSRKFYESPRRIDNCRIETLMLLKNILGEPLNWLSIILGDSTNLREVLTPFAAFLGEPLTQNKKKLKNCVLSCQSFSDIRRISEKDWYETHQYQRWAPALFSRFRAREREGKIRARKREEKKARKKAKAPSAKEKSANSRFFSQPQ
jgi:hypothetical protein